MTRLPGKPIEILTHGTSPIPSAGSSPASRSARTPLIDELPAYLIASGYFTEIDCPAAGFAPAVGQAAWYGLQSVRIDEDLGQEGALLAISADLRPTDSTAGATPPAGGTAAPWGNVWGTNAAIVVGMNLPITMNGWSTAPCNIPGVTVAAPGLVSAQGLSPYLWRTSFPSGKWSDTIPQRNYLTVSTAPLVQRLVQGRRLDIALVLNRAQAISAAGSGFKFVGYADVCAVIARRFGADPFQTQ